MERSTAPSDSPSADKNGLGGEPPSARDPSTHVLAMARLGFPVFPLRPGTKEPATARGFKDASRDPRVIRQWWTDNPQYGVGVATGHGLVVLDVDSPEGHGTDGPGSLTALERDHDPLPATAEVGTPSGGRHLWFEGPSHIRSRTGVFEGIDVKAAGGYVVVPPTSLHGKTYLWVSDLAETSLANLPNWLQALIEHRRVAEPIPETIYDGEGRERHLVSLAGTLRRRGLGPETILDILRAVNERVCWPPKPHSDLERIARSMANYEPGHTDDEGTLVAQLVEQAKTADGEDAIFELLHSVDPPTRNLAKAELRTRLVKVLRDKKMDSPARIIDAWLSERASREEEELQGEAFQPKAVAPWDAAVDGVGLLDEILGTLARYTYTTEENLVAAALWVVHSHAIDWWGVSPILEITSATKRCGKTSMLMPIMKLVKAGLPSSSITASSLFRLVSAVHPTLVIDEADTFLKMADEFRGILNAGHTRDTAFVVRVEGDSREPRVFSTWTPKVIAAIGSLPDTIEDRSIRLVLRRKPTHVQKQDAFDTEAVLAVCHPVQRRIVRWVSDHARLLASTRPPRPEGLNDREWNNWKPLLTIAEVAGGEWTRLARDAAKALSGREGEEDFGTLLLRHLKATFRNEERLSTKEILKALVDRDDGPWAKWWAADVGADRLRVPATRLAKLLKPFGIEPRQMKVEGLKVRGYWSADFVETWSTYAPGHWRLYAPPGEVEDEERPLTLAEMKQILDELDPAS